MRGRTGANNGKSRRDPWACGSTPEPQLRASAAPTDDLGRARSAWVLCLVVVCLLAGLAWLLFVRRAPLGYEWFVRVNPRPWPAGWLLEPVGVIACFGGLAGYLAFLARRHREARWGKWCRAGFVAALVVGTFWLQVAIVLLPPMGPSVLVAATYSEVSTEYFAAAWNMGHPGQYLRTHHEQMVDAHYHVGTHPPGAVLVYYVLIRVFYLVPGLAGAFGGWVEAAGVTPEVIAAWSRLPGMPQIGADAAAPAAFCSLALAFCGALSLVPVYFLATAVSSPRPGGEGTAMAATALSATVPSLLLFVPALDHLLLLVATTTLAAVAWGWRLQGRTGIDPVPTANGRAGSNPFGAAQSGLVPYALAAVAGVVWGVGCFVSFGLLALGPVMLLFLVLSAWRRWREASATREPEEGEEAKGEILRYAQNDKERRAGGKLLPYEEGAGWLGSPVGRAMLHLGLVCGGLVIVGLAVWTLLGVNLPEVWVRGMAAHREVTLGRTYRVWVGMNLLEFALFLGLPLAAACAAAVYWSILPTGRQGRRRKGARGIGLLSCLAFGGLITIVLLDVSGRVRGEVGRIWLFLMPPLALLAAARLWERRCGAALWGITVGGQLLQVLMMALTMTPIIRPW